MCESRNDDRLTDNGANEGMAGADMLICEVSDTERADITGIDDIEISDVPIGTAATKLQCDIHGTVIGMFHQYACREGKDGYGIGQTIHAPVQLEDFGCKVEDKVRRGNMKIIHPHGYVFRMYSRSGLPYLKQARCTPADLHKYPIVHMTADTPWRVDKYDRKIHATMAQPLEEDDEDIPELVVPTVLLDDDSSTDSDDTHSLSDRDDMSVQSEINLHDEFEFAESNFDPFELYVAACVMEAKERKDINLGGVTIPPRNVLPKKPNYELLRPHFAWINTDRIKATLKNTTQFFKANVWYPMKRHFKSRFPAANVPRIPDTVAFDTFFSDTPALDDGVAGHGGCTMAQIYHAITLQLTAAYPLAKKLDIPKTLLDFIREWGAPAHIFSDAALEEASEAIVDIFRTYCVGRHYTSEPHHQWQNPAERCIQDLKRMVNGLMDRTGARACEWLLCLLFVVQLMNVLSQDSLNGMTAYQATTGQLPDISAYLAYTWRQPVLFWPIPGDKSFPGGESKEELGWWMGPTKDQGDILTYYVLSQRTDQLYVRSEIRPADSPRNLRAERDLRVSTGTEGDRESQNFPFVQSLADVLSEAAQREQSEKQSIPELPHLRFSPDELPGMTFLKETSDGQKVRAEVVRKIDDVNAQNHKDIMFILNLGGKDAEELMSYVKICDRLEKTIIEHQNKIENGKKLYFFDEILDHKGPLAPGSEGYNGSRYNVKVRWDDGSETWEPLNQMIAQDPVTVAAYARNKGLGELDGWKKLRKFIR